MFTKIHHIAAIHITKGLYSRSIIIIQHRVNPTGHSSNPGDSSIHIISYHIDSYHVISLEHACMIHHQGFPPFQTYYDLWQPHHKEYIFLRWSIYPHTRQLMTLWFIYPHTRHYGLYILIHATMVYISSHTTATSDNKIKGTHTLSYTTFSLIITYSYNTVP